MKTNWDTKFMRDEPTQADEGKANEEFRQWWSAKKEIKLGELEQWINEHIAQARADERAKVVEEAKDKFEIAVYESANTDNLFDMLDFKRQYVEYLEELKQK